MEIPLRHSTPYPISCFFFIVGGQGCLCDTTYGFCEKPMGCCNSSCRPASSYGCGCPHRRDPPPASASSSASWGISLPIMRRYDAKPLQARILTSGQWAVVAARITETGSSAPLAMWALRTAAVVGCTGAHRRFS